jgi:FkbM family methyltransferase
MNSNINGLMLNVPDSFAGILPVSPSPSRFSFEEPAFFGIERVIREGSIVFDIGMSYGVMSSLMAKLVGVNGVVHSFEANPLVVTKSSELYEANSFDNRVIVNHCIVGDVSGQEREFFMVDGLKSVASTLSPGIMNLEKTTSRFVPMLSIDDYCSKIGNVPSVIKMDIEGAEYLALQGMKNTLLSLPDIVMETHGWSIDAIHGNMRLMLQELMDMGYGIFDITSARMLVIEDYVKNFSQKTGHILISAKLKDEQYSVDTRELCMVKLKEYKINTEVLPLVESMKKRFEENSQNELIEIFENNSELLKNSAEANYYYALSLHMISQFGKAISHYSIALHLGFTPFWVYYNRASLFYTLGLNEDSRKDAENGYKLDNNHDGLNQLMSEIIKVN